MSKHDHDRNHDPSTGPFPPVPWVDLAAAPASVGAPDVERRLGALFARVPEPAAFTAAAQARVAARLRSSVRGQQPTQRSMSRALFRPRWVMGWALAAAVLLVSGVVIAGGGVGPLWQRLKPRVEALLGSAGGAAPRERALSMRAPRAESATREAAAPASVPEVPVQAPDEASGVTPGSPAPALRQRQRPPRPRQLEGEPPARSRPRRSTGTRYAGTEGRVAVAAPSRSPSEAGLVGRVADAPGEKPAPVGAPIAEGGSASSSSSWAPAAEPPPSPARRAPVEPLPVAPPSQLSQEAVLLNKAMVQLRQRRDGAAALATLNEYLEHYPQGMLAAEARGARIDALLLLQRKGEALRALEAARLEPVGRGQELLVIRGELRARRDPAGAIRDFELALGRPAPAPLEERALYGRAVSRRRQGDEKGARADAARYLTRFPEGRFASTVRRLADGDSVRTP